MVDDCGVSVQRREMGERLVIPGELSFGGCLILDGRNLKRGEAGEGKGSLVP